MKENLNMQDVDTALIYFELNPKTCPKIDIDRPSRSLGWTSLAKHRHTGRNCEHGT